MKKYLVKCKGRWQLVIVSQDHLYLPNKVHKSVAQEVANRFNRRVLHSTSLICDYFGGTSKIYDYDPYSRQWVLAR